MKEKIKTNDTVILKFFWGFVSSHKKPLIIGLLAIPLSLLSSILMPVIIIRLIDQHLIAGNYDGTVQIIYLLAGLLIGGYLGDSIYTYSLQVVGNNTIRDMRLKLLNHVLRLPKNYYDTHPVGLVLTRITTDFEAIRESLASGVVSMTVDMLRTLVLVATLFYISVPLTLSVLAVVFPVYFMMRYCRLRLRRYSDQGRKFLAESVAFLHECLTGLKTVQILNLEQKTQKLFRKKNQDFYNTQKKSNHYEALMFSLVDGSTVISMAVIITVAVFIIPEGKTTVGVLVGFISALQRVFVPIREFSQQFTAIQRSLSSLRQIHTLFIEVSESTNQVKKNKEIPKSEREEFNTKELKKEEFNEIPFLEFDSVSFAYRKDTPPVLNNVSFKMDKGEKLAIVGKTGSGKSTIVRLISRQYENYTGRILMNGQEIRTYPRDEYLRKIASMWQDSYMFPESISFNIALEREGLNEDMIVQAAGYANAEDFIKRLPQQFDHKIEEYGKNLSAGEAQLINFSRSVAEESDLFILDEATGSVDSITERKIEETVEKIFTEKTVIAIAHRLSTIRKSDRIIVVSNGEVIESGSPAELEENKGYYSQLIQAGKDTV